VPPNLEFRRWQDAQIVAAAQVVRLLHDATEGSKLAGSEDVVCHGDLTPCNFVFVDGVPGWVIDFDAAHPGSRKSDLAYMAWMWLIGVEDEAESRPLGYRLRQVRLMLDTYGLEERDGFAAAIRARQIAVRESTHQRGSVTDWVDDEIEFVEAHSPEIEAAVARS
jgi:aminoglycoside phosphotransferase (APT) family kinase protein